MVLESLVSSRELLRHPLFMLFLAVLVSSTSLWIAYYTFPNSASVLSIALVTIALVPIIHRIFIIEETKEVKKPGFAPSFIARHFGVIKIYAFFFIGLILSYAIWFSVMPPEISAKVFTEQEHTLNQIMQLKSTLTGNLSISAGACSKDLFCWFEVIFYNNSSVLLLAVLLSFLYGAGAIFLIGWNASVIGVLIGRDITGIMQSNANIGYIAMFGAFFGGMYNALGLIPHGVPEALGYFIGAITGGIISAALSRRKYRSNEFEIVAKDALMLLIIALGLLALGAYIEASLIVATQ